MRLGRKPVLAGLAVLALAGVLVWWWTHQRVYPGTDDAYVGAHVLTVVPEVGGRIAELAVDENDHVAAGDLMFRIEDRALKAAVDQARARADAALQSAGAAAEAELDVARAASREAEADYLRQEGLFRRNDVSQSALDRALAARDQALAEETAAAQQLARAQASLGDEGDRNAGVREALAALQMAEIDLDHATVTAPESGWIANIDLRPGSVVTAGQALFSLVGDAEWWIEANFKETDLTRIRPGQPAAIGIDLCPALDLEGRVASIGPGAGAVFSLLPAQNATGNWVKVTRRIPVRIALDPVPEAARFCLKAGASATATVDTTAAPGP
ncbi:HlyD family secretion protein [Rhodovulum visakhapatnamense]|uniref:Membrane fusion protein (Multidrug efflux system) n=1 Tax=Rhodovulum visakhapatnamense TaxID=364297 RepID=A0A4R8G8U4_9RHOB|nr:HlyD family secretion protein [Rhodovulum visakhapatnamense]TDX33134.1 membrane fusion protein (multidrug efflux system) [Rhodovulum visakhapatnamense]